jgi:hypothetical protein
MSEIPGYTPPPPELKKRLRPKVTPGEVRGMLGHAPAQPDRVFLVLESRTDGPDRVWEVDGYCIRDEAERKERWRIHFICPHCDRGLTLDSEKKKMDITERGIEVEPFRCSWHGDFGALLCTFCVGIRLPKSQDEAVVRCDEDPTRTRRIDGVFVPA